MYLESQNFLILDLEEYCKLEKTTNVFWIKLLIASHAHWKP